MAVVQWDGWADTGGPAQAGGRGDGEVFHRTDCCPQAVFIGQVDDWGQYSAFNVNRVGGDIMVLEQIMKGVLPRRLSGFPPVWMQTVEMTTLSMFLVKLAELVLVQKDVESESPTPCDQHREVEGPQYGRVIYQLPHVVEDHCVQSRGLLLKRLSMVWLDQDDTVQGHSSLA